MRRRTIGRVVLTVDCLPAAFPVNDGVVVAFQVDRIDPVLQSGWSVLTRGVARAGRLALRPSAPGERPCFVRIRSDMVSGRRFLSPVEAMAESYAG
ncbi:MAG: pyridoxamine 5'-phosphate oxidase family protein [Actinomycetota bacterium]|nr:pyridoxamine 5'-phosphate oxidase family protein [Actinomycetota bacterium]